MLLLSSNPQTVAGQWQSLLGQFMCVCCLPVKFFGDGVGVGLEGGTFVLWSLCEKNEKAVVFWIDSFLDIMQ